MNKKAKLTKLFKDFPGIGPRQAQRFTYSLLYQDQNYLNNLSRLISEVKEETKICEICNRFFEKQKVSSRKICSTCLDKNKDNSKVLIVTKNQDFENIEKTKLWDGLYFLIGRNIKLTEKAPERKINLSALIKRIEKEQIKEITFALAFNPEGEHTKEYIKSILNPLQNKYKFKIFELGRGLSLGSEIEYSDRITLSDAFKNKHLE